MSKNIIDDNIANIIRAYSEEKEIEVFINGCWHRILSLKHLSEAIENNENIRIKPENKYISYKNAEEFLKDMKVHGPYLKGCGQYFLPILIGCKNENGIVLGSINPSFHSYDNILKYYVWQDGTPCGIIEENV